MNDSKLIELTQICKTYVTGTVSYEALKGIDLVIDKGEYLAILGPSGSGKSTLMHILGCLSTPTSGSYKLAGKEVSDLSRNELAYVRNREIGFVFQSFNLLTQLDIVENVALPLMYRGMSVSRRQEKARDILSQLGLASHLKHHPNELSGGQQQRVAIARALVTDPSVILADEPTGNLDSHVGNEVIALFEKFSAEGKTVILVTHDMEIAKRTRRIIRIQDGLISES